MKALQIKRSAPRFGMARLASALAPATAARLGPLEYTTIDDPPCPGEGWHRVRTRLAGICGSDLSLVEGHASLYFEDYVSFPFVPGHEVVGELDDGTRVVLEPVLGHEARGHRPPFDGAAPGDGDDYAHLVTGSLEAGIQTGFCCSTGGGWAPWFWAHETQLHRISADVPDERAVLVEPIAGGIHAALLTWPTIAGVTDPIVAVLGAGTMGLAAIAGLRRYVPGVRIVVGARYPHQIALAKAVGSSASIADCLRITRPRGRVVLLGMPAEVHLDLTGLWHRETELKGAYTYGTEHLPDGSTRRTFDLALETADALGAERLLSATYRLADHVDALANAATAGPRGAVKIAFDLREEK